MSYPPLLKLTEMKEYLLHYKANYSKVEVRTWDNIIVRFPGAAFYHLCYEDNDRDGSKDTFSWMRSERLDWIKKALQDDTATLFQGWNNKIKQYLDPTRRVVITYWDYIVVIKLVISTDKAEIITHFVPMQLHCPRLNAARPGKVLEFYKKIPLFASRAVTAEEAFVDSTTLGREHSVYTLFSCLNATF